MEDSKIISTLLLVFGIILAVTGVAYFVANTGPRISCLASTLDILRIAEGDHNLELKLADVERALEVYQSGSLRQNIQGLKLLIACNSTQEFNYLLPAIKGQINAERNNLSWNLHGMMQSVLVVGWLFTSGVGTFYDYEKWSTNEQHGYIAFQFALMLAIIVSFIP